MAAQIRSGRIMLGSISGATISIASQACVKFKGHEVNVMIVKWCNDGIVSDVYSTDPKLVELVIVDGYEHYRPTELGKEFLSIINTYKHGGYADLSLQEFLDKTGF